LDAAAADPLIRGWLEQWWDEAVPHLPMPAAETAGYRAALLDRFANPRIRHELAQVAADGSAKLPERVLPVLRLERSAGRLPLGAARILAAWVGHLRGHDMPVSDPEAPRLVSAAHGPWREAVARVLAVLDPALADDRDLLVAVADLGRELAPG